MEYKLKVYSLQEIGKRDNQEDSLFPAHGKAKPEDRLFILCDGMGGHDCGEIASQTVCQAMSETILHSDCLISKDLVLKAVSDALDMLDIRDNAAPKKMGTTMALLALDKEGYTIAHIGDSRVYHFRPGATKHETKILHKTEDHSLINYLVNTGQMTIEEARFSKKRNVIIRAMQPKMDPRPRPDVYQSKDILPGDYFYLCSDGMLEHMEDENLCFIMSKEITSDEEKMNILSKSTAQNKDNHAAFLIHVVDVMESFLPMSKTSVSASCKNHKKGVKTERNKKDVAKNNTTLSPALNESQSEDTSYTEVLDMEKIKKRNEWLQIANTAFLIVLACLFLLALIYYKIK